MKKQHHLPFQLITEIHPKPNAKGDEHIVQWQYKGHSTVIHTKEFNSLEEATAFKETLKREVGK